MALLSRDDIFGTTDMVYEDVSVPEWGTDVEVRVRSITGDERDKFEASIVQQNGRKTKVDQRNLRAKLIVLSAINEDGTPLFKPADVFKLGEKNAAALDRIFEVAQRLSGLSDDDVDEMTENFDNDPSVEDTSDSR